MMLTGLDTDGNSLATVLAAHARVLQLLLGMGAPFGHDQRPIPAGYHQAH